MNPLYTTEHEAIELQPRSSDFRPDSAVLQQNANPFRTSEPPQEDIEDPSSDSSKGGCALQNNCFTVFKRVFSALLIIGDVLIDWTALADVLIGTATDENKLTQNEEFKFSFPVFSDAERALNNSAKTDKCNTSTVSLSLSYAGFVIFGTVFALVKLLNIVGETRREICEDPKNNKRNKKSQKKEKKKEKSFGFQLLHGWVETFFALLFEDLPQNFLLLLYSTSCKSISLNKIKTLVSMIGSFVKNVWRKSTCKQKTGCACCLYSYDIGCMNFTCLSCVLCSCCKSAQAFYPDGSLVKTGNVKEPIENVQDQCMCCKCVELEWGCAVNIPPVCSCGRCVLIEEIGCCDRTTDFDNKCCEPDFYCSEGCCGKRIDKDPIWLQKYISLCYLINIAIIVLYFLGINLDGMFGL